MASLVDLYTQNYKETAARNTAREAEIRGLLSQNLKTYEPGGAFAKAGERAIEQTYAQDMSRIIGAGLYGTTVGESTAGAARRQGRLTLESLLEEGRSRARSAYADFIERIQDEYPDLGGLTQAYASMGSVPRTGTSPSTRPGWAIGYGQPDPLERTPAVEATTPTREVPAPTSRTSVYGPSASVPSVRTAPGDTLSRLYAEGRAEPMSVTMQPSVFAKKKKPLTYEEMMNQLNPWLNSKLTTTKVPYGATGSW